MIGIFGDSFASGEHEQKSERHAWPRLYAQLLNEGYECHAKPSTSIWWSYELFLKHFKKYNKIVFTYSHYSRWSYLPEHLVGFSDAVTKNSILSKAIPMLYSEELQLFTYQNIFNNVNKLCKENNIKLINLMPFERILLKNKLNNFYIDTSNSTGSCLTGLLTISENEAVDKYGVFHADLFMGVGFDRRAAHLSLENNKVLALIIMETFNSDKIEVKNLCDDTRFLKGTFFNENRFRH